MSGYPMPQPNLDYPWENVPEPVRVIVIETQASLTGGKITRGKVRESYNVYTVALFVTPEGEERPTHAVRISCDYTGKNPRKVARVRLGDMWL